MIAHPHIHTPTPTHIPTPTHTPHTCTLHTNSPPDVFWVLFPFPLPPPLPPLLAVVLPRPLLPLPLPLPCPRVSFPFWLSSKSELWWSSRSLARSGNDSRTLARCCEEGYHYEPLIQLSDQETPTPLTPTFTTLPPTLTLTALASSAAASCLFSSSSRCWEICNHGGMKHECCTLHIMEKWMMQ